MEKLKSGSPTAPKRNLSPESKRNLLTELTHLSLSASPPSTRRIPQERDKQLEENPVPSKNRSPEPAPKVNLEEASKILATYVPPKPQDNYAMMKNGDPVFTL